MDRVKFKDGKYWIEIGYGVIGGKRKWFWAVKSCNGRNKCSSCSIYEKKSYAYNDAKAFALYCGLTIRGESYGSSSKT